MGLQVRPVKQAVTATFGETPIFFMQHALLEAENQMRFERYHCFDFEEIRWKQWINERLCYWAGERYDEGTG